MEEEEEDGGCCCCVAEEKSPPEEDPAAGVELPKIEVPEEEVAAVPNIDWDCPAEPNVLEAAVLGANKDLFGDEEDPANEFCPDCPKALLAPKTDVDDPVTPPPPPPKIDGCTAVVDV